MLKAGMLEVMRTAGSHGVADLIGIHSSGRVHLVQVKRVQNTAQAKRLIKSFKENPPLPDGEYNQYLVVYNQENKEYLEEKL